MDLISIANDLHKWLDEQDNSDIITKKVKIISENLDDVIHEDKLYKAVFEHKLYEHPTEKNN